MKLEVKQILVGTFHQHLLARERNVLSYKRSQSVQQWHTLSRKCKVSNMKMIIWKTVLSFSLKLKWDDSACDPEAISQSKVKGKIVYCLKTYTDPYIKSLGGTGVIQLTRQQADYSSILLLPGVTIPSLSGKYIDLYINSTKYVSIFLKILCSFWMVSFLFHWFIDNRNPKAVIYKSKTVRIDAPFVASFSSRGPQFISSNILKV